jgi:hypothetical protein
MPPTWRVLMLSCVLTASALSPSLAQSAAASSPALPARACPGQLLIGPDPVDFVYSIQAHAVSCGLARSVARGSRQAGASFDARLRYSSHGFACRGRFVPNPAGKGHLAYRCAKTGAVITFDHN